MRLEEGDDGSVMSTADRRRNLTWYSMRSSSTPDRRGIKRITIMPVAHLSARAIPISSTGINDLFAAMARLNEDNRKKKLEVVDLKYTCTAFNALPREKKWLHLFSHLDKHTDKDGDPKVQYKDAAANVMAKARAAALAAAGT